MDGFNSNASDKNAVKYRECDDMLARRLAGNIPTQVKKNSEASHSKFITPSGNPMKYVLEHKRNKERAEMEDEKKMKEAERNERNARYHDMENLKEMLKDEETVWTSKLDDWKQRRRSATFDVRRRKEDRDSMMQESMSYTPRRRAKTYREIVEDKKKRDSKLLSSDDYSNYDELKYESWSNGGYADYGSGAVPNVTVVHKESDGRTSTVDNANQAPVANDANEASGTKSIQPEATPKHHSTRAEERAIPVSGQSSEDFSSNSEDVLSPAEAVEHRKSRADESSAKLFVEPVEKRVAAQAPRRQVVVNNRLKFESMTTERDGKNHRPAPIDLSALLKKDAEHSQVNGGSREPTDENSLPSSDASYDIPFEPVPKLQLESCEDRHEHFDHKPKIMGANVTLSRSGFSQPPRPNAQFAQNTFEPIQKHGNAPIMRGSSAALPSKLRISMVEEKVDKVKSQEQENPLQLDVPGQKPPGFSPRRSPRGGAGGIDSLFEDLTISIKQLPKYEKGFGFTVRGGDDGRPVVINTVNPGGAADLSHLCVGDEILSINLVRLSSSLTQDDIVQLIVESVIAGSLTLDVRRYGKTKKVTTPRLLGTPRGYYGRPDQNNTFSRLQFPVQRDASGSTDLSFPPPPPSFLQRDPSPHRKANPASDARGTTPTFLAKNRTTTGKENKLENINLVEPRKDKESTEAEEKRKRIEKAKKEEQQIAEQLKKIELAKEEQRRQHDAEKRRLLLSNPGFLHRGMFKHDDRNHWLVEEAERSRLAEREGKPRVNIIEYTKENRPANVSNHVTRRSES